MARKKTTETIEAEIIKVRSDMSKLQDRYEELAKKLEALQEKKLKCETDAIMEAYLKSGKNFDEIMTFLMPQ